MRQYFVAKKLQSQYVTREKLHKTLLYEKFARKMLMTCIDSRSILSQMSGSLVNSECSFSGTLRIHPDISQAQTRICPPECSSPGGITAIHS